MAKISDYVCRVQWLDGTDQRSTMLSVATQTFTSAENLALQAVRGSDTWTTNCSGIWCSSIKRKNICDYLKPEFKSPKRTAEFGTLYRGTFSNLFVNGEVKKTISITFQFYYKKQDDIVDAQEIIDYLFANVLVDTLRFVGAGWNADAVLKKYCKRESVFTYSKELERKKAKLLAEVNTDEEESGDPVDGEINVSE